MRIWALTLLFCAGKLLTAQSLFQDIASLTTEVNQLNLGCLLRLNISCPS
jgi:hypothetical protein